MLFVQTGENSAQRGLYRVLWERYICFVVSIPTVNMPYRHYKNLPYTYNITQYLKNVNGIVHLFHVKNTILQKFHHINHKMRVNIYQFSKSHSRLEFLHILFY